ncbi:MAG TPA: prepilin-type N-terminal cleavage/methylation domain-containing protein [Gammaproteobacteria bacterium]|nr:prepilin-type N-terminal cleavage/methylation domain-containing protein [Gammaproteobacteria bacterium]
MNRTQQGFTLIELVLVIVVLSLASVPLFSLFTQASTSLLQNEAIQTAAQLAQERAEFILSRRRELGFNGAVPELAVGTINENLNGSFSAFSRTTVISQPPVPPAGCPAGAVCKQVVVDVTTVGPSLARIAFLLVNY